MRNVQLLAGGEVNKTTTTATVAAYSSKRLCSRHKLSITTTRTTSRHFRFCQNIRGLCPVYNSLSRPSLYYTATMNCLNLFKSFKMKWYFWTGNKISLPLSRYPYGNIRTTCNLKTHLTSHGVLTLSSFSLKRERLTFIPFLCRFT